MCTCAFDPFGSRGKLQDSHCMNSKQQEFNFIFAFGLSAENRERKTCQTEGNIQKLM